MQNGYSFNTALSWWSRWLKPKSCTSLWCTLAPRKTVCSHCGICTPASPSFYATPAGISGSSRHRSRPMTLFNLLKHRVVNWLYTCPSRSNLPLLISDIRALWCWALSARVPERRKLKLQVRTGWHWALRNVLTPLRFKWLMISTRASFMLCHKTKDSDRFTT